MFKPLAALALSFLALAGATSLSMAKPIGSPALAIRPLTLLSHPGLGHAEAGSLDKGARVLVERCQKLWCRVTAGGSAGWVAIDDLSFGTAAAPRWTGARLHFAAGGDGKVCLYEGANYTGAKLCGKTGFVLRDLATAGLDNHFASISVEGGVSAIVCRTRTATSYCVRFSESQPHLNGLLSHAISSFRVY